MIKYALIMLLVIGFASNLAADDNVSQAMKNAVVGAKSDKTPDTFQNSLGMKFVLIKPGTFLMGAGEYDQNFDENEKPQHEVEISKAFYVGATEVTQEQYQNLMGSNPSRFQDPSNPVERVTYKDALNFIDKLNAKEKTKSYGLPTEARWEYFTRAGTISPYFYGDDDASLSKYAWYRDNSGNKTHPVGGLAPNPWGLYDVYGNVAEMLSDFFKPDYYAMSPKNDPTGANSGPDRALRGGAYSNTSFGLRSSARDRYNPKDREIVIGFRLVMEVPDDGVPQQK